MANQVAKACIKQGQHTHQLNAMRLEDDDGRERQVYDAMSMGAVNTKGKKW